MTLANVDDAEWLFRFKRKMRKDFAALRPRYVLVPVEPTRRMISGARAALKGKHKGIWYSEAEKHRKRYQAMIAGRPS